MRMIHSLVIHEKPPSKRPRIRSSPLTLTGVGALQLCCNNTFVFRCPQGNSKPHSCPSFDIVFPSLRLSFSPSSPFTSLQNCLDLEMWPYLLNFRFFVMVRRSPCTPAGSCCEPLRSSHGLCSLRWHLVSRIHYGMKRAPSRENLSSGCLTR